MTIKKHILNSLADGRDIGECEIQIQGYLEEFFEHVSYEVIREKISELVVEKMIYDTGCFGPKKLPMYAMTKEGWEAWKKIDWPEEENMP
ncbi:MAG: hypothetical protein FWE16_04950 [Firmicutes bacterium]|nr:hypothetical protein [Bacillota bacterium]